MPAFEAGESRGKEGDGGSGQAAAVGLNARSRSEGDEGGRCGRQGARHLLSVPRERLPVLLL